MQRKLVIFNGLSCCGKAVNLLWEVFGHFRNFPLPRSVLFGENPRLVLGRSVQQLALLWTP